MYFRTKLPRCLFTACLVVGLATAAGCVAQRPMEAVSDVEFVEWVKAESLESDPARVESLMVKAGLTYVLPLGTSGRISPLHE